MTTHENQDFTSSNGQRRTDRRRIHSRSGPTGRFRDCGGPSRAGSEGSYGAGPGLRHRCRQGRCQGQSHIQTDAEMQHLCAIPGKGDGCHRRLQYLRRQERTGRRLVQGLGAEARHITLEGHVNPRARGAPGAAACARPANDRVPTKSRNSVVFCVTVEVCGAIPSLKQPCCSTSGGEGGIGIPTDRFISRTACSPRMIHSKPPWWMVCATTACGSRARWYATTPGPAPAKYYW